jgi:hypothetical protein
MNSLWLLNKKNAKKCYEVDLTLDKVKLRHLITMVMNFPVQ